MPGCDDQHRSQRQYQRKIRHLRPGRKQGGRHCHDSGDDANRQSDEQQRAVLAQHQPFQRARTKTNGDQQCQFAATLQNIAHHHDAESHAAKQQAQPAQNLEGGEIRVLHGIECGQSLRGRREFQSHVAQGARKRFGNFIHLLWRRVDEEHSVAGLRRKARDELVLGDDQIALQNRIRQRADEPDFEGAAAFIRVIHRVADLFSHRPDNRRLIADGGDYIWLVAADVRRRIS